MNFKKQISRFGLICSFLASGIIQSSQVAGAVIICISSGYHHSSGYTKSDTNEKSEKEIEKLNESLIRLLRNGDTANCGPVVETLIRKIGITGIEDTILSESYYYIGIYNLIKKEYNESIRYFDLCVAIKVKDGEYDERYAKALYNLGSAYFNIGDFKKHKEYSFKSLDTEKKINGESSPVLAGIYLSLSAAFLELQEYENAINYSNLGLAITENKAGKVLPEIIAGLYTNLGVCYVRLADFSKAKIYLDKAESVYKQFDLSTSENSINLINSLAITYSALGLEDESGEYYKKVIALAIANNSPMAYNIINSYSIFLADNGKAQQGEELLQDALERARIRFGLSQRSYIEVLLNYANYLRDYKIDNKKSLACLEKCLEYLQSNKQDISLKALVLIGYSLSQDYDGEQLNALETIQSLLIPDQPSKIIEENYINPSIDKIKPDRLSLRILNTKYRILWDIYKKSGDQKSLVAASNTSELIVSLLEKVRINISEDDSRLILGDRYRDSYLNVMRDFDLLFNKTHDRVYLEKAFEYSEKSKVAGLLTSTRELQATQLNIPSGIGDYEKKLQGDISLFNARLYEETASEKTNPALINTLKENLLNAIRSRDSLVLVFEKEYPVYYSIKYNTQVAELKDIPKILGKNANYVNYILSDSLLYTFVANRKKQQLIVVPVDSLFFKDVRKFRNLLTMPSPTDNSSLNFKEFQEVGDRLYKVLIAPVRPYLISDKLCISPDNILSYIPFETIPASPGSQKSLMYRDLNYLMNIFDISYTYSATFTAESEKKAYSKSNKLIAFAPDYPRPIDIQSALMSRQGGLGKLNDLPFARQEAKYVSDLTGGILYENSDAKESVFKKESGKYDIIHLAMHTLLNDREPMHSTLIFSQDNDFPDDGYLKTFEIYGIPLKAKMVVLSSCNTGTGLLYSGEGILSLARGFIYSGSQSVVMSMWEIEDKSGTQIVEMFYNNLKKGYSKSVALKKARMEFLKNSDQLRSHPYFWSALVVYGSNAPLYHSNRLKIIVISIFTILLLYSGFYFWKRKYS